MTELKALDDATLLRVTDTLWDAQRLLNRPATEAIATLGWTVLEGDTEGIIRLNPGFGLTRGNAAIGIDQYGRVTSILVHICDATIRGGPQARVFRQDLFARASAALTAAYGPPTDRLPGLRPELWWRQGTAVLRLFIGWHAVTVQIIPATVVDNPEM